MLPSWSCFVTATGTARFAVAMGYDVEVGYAVGGVFDLAKSFLLVALLALWGRRSLALAAPLKVLPCTVSRKPATIDCIRVPMAVV